MLWWVSSESRRSRIPPLGKDHALYGLSLRAYLQIPHFPERTFPKNRYLPLPLAFCVFPQLSESILGKGVILAWTADLNLRGALFRHSFPPQTSREVAIDLNGNVVFCVRSIKQPNTTPASAEMQAGLFASEEMEWLQNNPAVAFLTLVASLITIGGAIWACVKYVPSIRAFVSEISLWREKKRMICRYCEGTGKDKSSFRSLGDFYVHEKCHICKGHGEINTALWSQPDCRFCGGRGIATDSTSGVFVHEQCPVCRGYGKKPF